VIRPLSLFRNTERGASVLRGRRRRSGGWGGREGVKWTPEGGGGVATFQSLLAKKRKKR